MSRAIRVAEFADLSPAVRAFIANPKKLYIDGKVGGGRFGQDLQHH